MFPAARTSFWSRRAASPWACRRRRRNGRACRKNAAGCHGRNSRSPLPNPSGWDATRSRAASSPPSSPMTAARCRTRHGRSSLMPRGSGPGNPARIATGAIPASSRPTTTRSSASAMRTPWPMSPGCPGSLGRLTACRARRSGNMPAAPGRRRPGSGATGGMRRRCMPRSLTGRWLLPWGCRSIRSPVSPARSAALWLLSWGCRSTRSVSSTAIPGFRLPPRSARPGRTRSASTTCWAMCGNGWRIAGTMACRTFRRMAQLEQPVIVAGVPCAAGLGSALRWTSAPANAAGTAPATAARAPASVWPEVAWTSRSSTAAAPDPHQPRHQSQLQ
jgi:hypothetical protein